MKKFFRVFFAVVFTLCITLLSACNMDSSNSNKANNSQYDEIAEQIEQLEQIYELAKKHGYEGSYDDWIKSLKGDQVEIRANGGMIQWRYTKNSRWEDLISIEDLKGENGVNGFTPEIKEGYWWIGDYNTGVKAEGTTGKSAYEMFIQTHPEYEGDEDQWLEDLINGNLSLENYRYLTVSYYDGKNLYEKDDVLWNKTIEAPEDPVKAGYIFVGWYTRNDKKWDFDANVVRDNISLYARWVKANITPTVKITNVTSDAESVSFELFVDDISTVEKVVLYEEGVIISEGTANTRDFEGLLSNNEYRIEVTYSYDINDGMGIQYTTTSAYVSTLPKSVPSIHIEKVEATTNSVSYLLNEIDSDNIGNITSVDLVYKGEVIASSNVMTDVFEDLLSNTIYTVRVSYEYDLNDGSNPVEITLEEEIRTVELFVPVVTINNLEVDQSSIKAKIVISDSSNIDRLISIVLYKGDEQIASSGSLDLEFTGLEANTEYTIVVNHQYDINDGNGVVNASEEYKVTTHPIYTLSNTYVTNTKEILSDDFIAIAIELENESLVDFKKVVINGVEYNTLQSTEKNKLLVNIPLAQVGTSVFVVEQLLADINGNEYIAYVNENNVCEADIYQRLIVNSLEVVDRNSEQVDYVYATENHYVLINLDNPQGYAVEYVVINDKEYSGSSVLDIIDDNTIRIKYSDSQDGVNQLTLSKIVYTINTSEGEVEYESSLAVESNHYVKLTISTPTEISTVDQLKAIADDTGYRHYVLTNDIILDSSDKWVPIENLNGVFDGAGYKIQNLSAVEGLENERIYLGLFKQASGLIKSLTIDSLTFMVTLDSMNNKTFDSYIGAFVADGTGTIILSDCHLNNSMMYVDFSIDESNNYLGGFVGNGTGVIKNSSVSNNITVDNSKNYLKELYVGAFVGRGDFKIYNSYNTGNITYNTSRYNNDYGMFIGGTYDEDGDNQFISECYNTGAYNGKYGFKLGVNVENSKSFDEKYANMVMNWSKKRYSFNTNGGEPIADIYTVALDELPTPVKDGSYFYGWYDNAEFEGERITGSYYSNEDKVFYAKWLDDVEDEGKFIKNDSVYPFKEEGGVLYSTNVNLAEETTVIYEIVASTAKIRVFFSYEYEANGGGSYDILHDKVSLDQPIYIEENVVTYLDLEVGESLKFIVTNYPNSNSVLKVSNIQICEF